MSKGRGGGKTPDMLVELLNAEIMTKGQSCVERETGLSHSMISRYKRGIGEPSSKNLKILADYFGISVWQLQGNSGGFFWANSKDVVDKVLEISSLNFDLALENDHRLINDFSFISVILSLATLVLEINSTESSDGNYDFRESVQNKAKRVIERYGDWYRQGMVDVLSDTVDKFEEQAE